jgi:hypothetical protein
MLCKHGVYIAQLGVQFKLNTVWFCVRKLTLGNFQPCDHPGCWWVVLAMCNSTYIVACFIALTTAA